MIALVKILGSALMAFAVALILYMFGGLPAIKYGALFMAAAVSLTVGFQCFSDDTANSVKRWQQQRFIAKELAARQPAKVVDPVLEAARREVDIIAPTGG